MPPTNQAKLAKGTTKAIQLLEPESVGPEILAQSIRDVAAAATKLLAGPLNRRALFILIQSNCDRKKVSLSDIETVLTAASTLGEAFVKDFKKK